MTLTSSLLFALVAMATVTIAAGGAELYADLAKLHGLLRTADDRVVQLASKNCQTGSGFVEFCPFYGNGVVETFKCITESAFSGPVTKLVEINFGDAFVTKPSVGIFTSGLTWAFGTSYNITVVKVTPKDLTVQVSGLFAPSAVRFNYIACDQEMLFPKAYLDIQNQIAFYES